MRNCITTAFLAVLGALSIAAASADATTGNRYGYPVLYYSEISSAKAWLDVISERHQDFDDSDRHNHHDDGQDRKKPVILDVRRIEEYVAGHPVGATAFLFRM